MASRKLQRLGLSPSVVQRLKRNNVLTCQDLLSKSRLELIKLTGLTDSAVKEIVRVASRACLPEHRTALSMHSPEFKKNSVVFMNTSLRLLDDVLHGGLPSGTITEIAGPSGCGKTQFCIMLSVLAALPQSLGGLDGAVAYIDTESSFTAKRLVEVAKCRFPDHFNQDIAIVSLASRVHVYIAATCSSLLSRLENLEEDLISKGVRLVILDSVASLIRKEFDSSRLSDVVARTNLLSKQAGILKYLAESFSIPVVVTNQITTRRGADKSGTSEANDGTVMDSSGYYIMAALGNTWCHSVNTRLILQYVDETCREILVAKSPVAPFTTLRYTIQDKGIVMEDNGDNLPASSNQGTDPAQQKIRVRTSLPLLE